MAAKKKKETVNVVHYERWEWTIGEWCLTKDTEESTFTLTKMGRDDLEVTEADLIDLGELVAKSLVDSQAPSQEGKQ